VAPPLVRSPLRATCRPRPRWRSRHLATLSCPVGPATVRNPSNLVGAVPHQQTLTLTLTSTIVGTNSLLDTAAVPPPSHATDRTISAPSSVTLHHLRLGHELRPLVRPRVIGRNTRKKGSRLNRPSQCTRGRAVIAPHNR
jgi:hypothetical protein